MEMFLVAEDIVNCCRFSDERKAADFYTLGAEANAVHENFHRCGFVGFI